MTHPSRASLDEIAAAVPISTAQSAAIVSVVAERLNRWISAAKPDRIVVPELADLAIHRHGHIWWFRGKVVPPSDVVSTLGEMLDALLRRSDAAVPAGLRYIVARATDRRHLAPFASLSEFASAVSRHAPESTAHAIDALLARYLMTTSGHPPLGAWSTISDIRRLRRAGGVTLPQIAEDTGIPLSLLRELEWGVFAHWDPWHTARSLEAYAHRAGLDPADVTRVIRREVGGGRREPVPVIVERRRPRALVSAGTSIPFRLETLPYAIGALLVVLVTALAPADRQQTGMRASRTEPATVQPASLVESISNGTENDDIELPPVPSRVSPTRNTGDAPTSVPATAPPTADDARRREPKPLVRRQRPSPDSAPAGRLGRLVRVIAGDGRHKVEPFPRVKDE